MIGWTCPSCGVNYAPSVTQCRCSAAPVVDDQVRKWIDDFEKSDKPLTPRKAPTLPPLPPYVPTPPAPWVDPWTPPMPPITVPWTDPAEYWRQPPWKPGRWYCRNDVVLMTPIVDTVNIDYLQLASLGGRQ